MNMGGWRDETVTKTEQGEGEDDDGGGLDGWRAQGGRSISLNITCSVF